ncbi:MAG TPA: hypothetical protein VF613_01635 [Longimicrobium sp.]|jgi:hypothetical protein
MTDLNADSPVHALVQQREQLRGWIAKLDEVSAGAPTRVAERIRQDYRERLERVTSALGEHRDEIGRSLEAMRLELHEAEERHTLAGEALEEMRLRHLIGELGDAEWETQRGRLDVEVASAEAEMRRLTGETERLAALAAEVSGEPASAQTAFASVAEEPADETAEPLAFIEDAPVASEPAPEAEAEAETAGWLNEISLDPAPASDPAPPAADASADEWDPFGEGFGGAAETRADTEGDLPWLETSEPATPEPWSPASSEGDGLEFLNDLGTSVPETPSTGDLAEDDLAFLEELDRAISGAPSASRPATPPPAASGDPAPGGSGGPLLCKECGAINEPHSWYCEICGSEL